MTTRAEARYRIEAPNSQPRAVKVIALDAASELRGQAARAIALESRKFPHGVVHLPARRARGGPFSVPGWLSDLAGRTKDLIDEIASADLVVMIATAGENAQAGSLIGEACMARRVMTTGLVLGTAGQDDETLARTLASLRPHARMLVIASSDDYIADMLVALRA